jgi:cytosine/adenosine deaminase-related metal-dependent hydrolase
MPDIVVRRAYLADRDAVVDVAVDDGEIREIAPEVADEGAIELEADGNLVSPGLVDAHVHLDMARSARDGRRPRYNDAPFDMAVALERSASYFADGTLEAVEENARRALERGVANGVLHVRTHAYVDGRVGADVVERLLDLRDRLGGVADVDIVAFPQQGIVRDDGSEAAVRRALEAGADVAGGLDPVTLNGDREETIAAWFDVATDHDVDLDVHVHERDATGMETLERLAERAVEAGYEDRVTASHAFALADAGDRLPAALDRFRDARLDLVTCYQSTPTGMPIRECHGTGLTMAHGTDQFHDLWGAHGNLDPLEAMLVESLKLDGYSTNRGLRTLWDLVTTHGASVLDLEGYDVEPGTPANLVVHSASSPEWAILENDTPDYVIKDGSIVAEGGVVKR